MKQTSSIFKVLASSLVCLCASAAYATPLTSTVFHSFALDNPTTAEREGWAYTNNVVNGVSENPQTGQWRLTYEGTLYDTFCLEPTQYLKFGDEYKRFQKVNAIDTDVDSLTVGETNRLSRLYEASFASSQLDANHSAAFQLAIWEILHDNNLDIAAGNFLTITGNGPTDTSQTIFDLTREMLNGLDAKQAGNWEFHRLINPVIQDQLIATNVPLPSSAPLLAIGLLGFALRTRTNR